MSPAFTTTAWATTLRFVNVQTIDSPGSAMSAAWRSIGRAAPVETVEFCALSSVQVSPTSL